MTKRLRIIHCSDLHLDPTKLADCQIVLDAFQQDVARRVQADGPFDLLVFTGDLVKEGKNKKAFECAREKFIIPTLTAAGLTEKNFCAVPGNHDVQLNELNEIYENGVTGQLTNRDAINAFLDNYDAQHRSFIDRRFRYFNAATLPEVEQRDQELFRTRIYDFSIGKIGIALLNTAWHASGKANDYDLGKIILGERQVDVSADRLKACLFKIAVFHHPFDWLLPADKTSVMRAMQRHFDLVLFGHAHYQDPMSLVGVSGHFFQSQTGCLYSTRDYFNGYSIVDIDFGLRQFKIELREYYDERRVFDNALRFAENGIYIQQFQRHRAGLDLVLSDEAQSAFQDAVNCRLISAVAAASAPKNIRELFVSPDLRTSTGQGEVADQGPTHNQNIQVSELMQGNANWLIYGQKETGKTTLLNFLAVEALPGGRYFDGTLPLRLQFTDIGASATTIFEGIRRASGSAIETKQIRAALKTKKVLILIDNFDVDQQQQIDTLGKFIQDHPGNRVIATALYDPIRKPVDVGNLLGISFSTLYLSYFARKQVKELILRWAKGNANDVTQLADRIMITASRINAPLTPLLISILLWLNERNISFEPVNHAVLLQTFVRELLGKLGGPLVKRADLDTRNVEHFLGHLAEFFTKEFRETASRMEVERVAAEYFVGRWSLDLLKLSVGEIIGSLIERGILIESDAGVGFRYRCFFEYFAAQRMGDEIEFYQHVTSENNLLRFAREIDTYTALNRNDSALLKRILDDLSAYYTELDHKSELNGFDRLPLPLTTKDTLSHEEIRHGLETSKLEEQERDNVFDLVTRGDKDQCPVSVRRDIEHYVPGELLDLASRVLRNSELIKIADDKKQEVLTKICSYWAILIAEGMLATENAADDQDLPQDIRELGPVFPLVILPQALSELCQEAVGSAKLGHILRRVSESDENPLIVRLLAALIYFGLKLDRRIDVIKSLFPAIKDKRFLLGMGYLKLRVSYTLGEFSRSEAHQLLDVLTDFSMAVQMSGNMNEREFSQMRSILQTQLKKTLTPRITHR
ncbi:hypothetical protein EZJ19_02460 [Parasulfuritortus cantonensis]|uniref:Uncharacterized protein n=1 Tax=Parasulfuritortus cantonensis TaxID=2528202 RepID=A0A4R1BLS4_9PROT|nr:metallophosphoesterase [Parasulfuritortus cantonensis]TCJ18391.1 hypothetical protein EZJ19_02460 [Parasulfuritortus cantonensis]